VLASVGSVGDAYDNALAESFVDSFKTELIKDRVWRSRSQVEIAVVEYVDWFNTRRLHGALDDRPPVEIEAEWTAENGLKEQRELARTAPNGAVDETPHAGLCGLKDLTTTNPQKTY
jgi:hypothetical protein